MEKEKHPTLFEFVVGVWLLIAGIVWVCNEVIPTVRNFL